MTSNSDSRKVVSLNDMADLVQNFSSGNIDGLLEPLGLKKEPVTACDNRCGCVGIDCSCRGQVGSFSVNEQAWRNLTDARTQFAKTLKAKLTGDQ